MFRYYYTTCVGICRVNISRKSVVRKGKQRQYLSVYRIGVLLELWSFLSRFVVMHARYILCSFLVRGVSCDVMY